MLFRQPIFTPKTYNHAVTYNHASADDNLQIHYTWLITNVIIGESQISIEVIKNIFTEMFREQNEKQVSLFKLYEETILSIIRSSRKITTQQLKL